MMIDKDRPTLRMKPNVAVAVAVSSWDTNVWRAINGGSNKIPEPIPATIWKGKGDAYPSSRKGKRDRAARAIVRGDEPIPPQPEDTEAAMRLILSGASPAESSALISAARNPQTMGSDQLCVATRALYSGAMRLPRKDALAVARAILFQPG